MHTMKVGHHVPFFFSFLLPTKKKGDVFLLDVYTQPLEVAHDEGNFFLSLG